MQGKGGFGGRGKGGGNGFCKGGRGQGKGRGRGKGSEGVCVCPSCGYSMPHERGVPCSQMVCPNCKSRLVRE